VSSPFSSLAVALMTALLLLAFSGYQVTNETAGPRLLGRLAASLVELDRWAPSHREDIQLLARDRADATVLIDDLPVDVLVPSDAVLATGEDDQALSDLLRDAMGRRLYAEGRGVLQDEEGQSHLSVTDPVRWAVSMLDADMHGTWRLALIGTALLTAVFAGSFVLSKRSPLAPMAAGAGLAVVVSFFGWLIAGGLDSMFDSAVDKEVVDVFREGAWLGLRNSLAAGAALLALLYLYRTLVEPRIDYDDGYYWPGEEEDDYEARASEPVYGSEPIYDEEASDARRN
jgi:hypothetical protein